MNSFTSMSVSPAMSPATLIERLLAAAFAPALNRVPRSSEYTVGVRALLLGRLVRRPLACPYKLGTAAADAFFAGVDEGSRIWADYVRDQSPLPADPVPA